MSPHRLPDHVRAVAVRDDIVFLDIASDVYFCLVGAGEVLDLSPAGAIQVDDPEVLAPLVEAGLVEPGTPAKRRDLPARPTIDPSLGPVRASPRQLRAAGLACVSAGLDLARLDFSGLISRAQAGRTDRQRAPDPEVIAAARTFQRARVWSPVGGACFSRSYLMLTFLRRLGLDADWVIGVRTWPFMAHCWLQSGDVALDEDVERITAYTPILVV